MKRAFVIILVFLVTSTLFLTSCTCYDENGVTCKGPGYYNFLFLSGDCSNPNDDPPAEEGRDYSTPSLHLEHHGSDQAYLTFKMTYSGRLYVDIEICVVQDGRLLYSHVIEGSYGFYEEGDEKAIAYSGYIDLKGYQNGGGEVYCFINRLEAIKK